MNPVFFDIMSCNYPILAVRDNHNTLYRATEEIKIDLFAQPIDLDGGREYWILIHHSEGPIATFPFRNAVIFYKEVPMK